MGSSGEKPAYDLTIFKLHCGKLTLKIYTKGERVLRIEVVVHNTQQLRCGHSLEKFPQILMQAKDILERFMDALSCIDQCFIADSTLAEVPAPSSVGKNKVGGIDLNRARMRWVVEAPRSARCIAIGPGIYGFGVGPPSSAAEQPKRIGLRPSACRLSLEETPRQADCPTRRPDT
jgi:hypothetical protein